MFKAIVWHENLNTIFSDKECVAENRTLDDVIKYFGKTGGLSFLFFKKTRRLYHCKMFNAVLEIFGTIRLAEDLI